VNDRARIAAGAAVGALVGGLATYFALTPGGRDLLARLGPALDDTSAALQDFRIAVGKAEGVARDARGAVVDVRAAFAGDRDLF
jgi:hypothetical protein